MWRVYYRDNLNVTKLDLFYKAPDSLAVNVVLRDSNLYVACIYRSQSLNLSQNNVILSCIGSICDINNENSETLIVGDLNLPDVSWVTGSINGCNLLSINQKIVNQVNFMNMFNDKGLSWYFTTETKACEWYSPRESHGSSP